MKVSLAVLIIIGASSSEGAVISSVIRHASNSFILPSLGLGRKERKRKKSHGCGRNN